MRNHVFLPSDKIFVLITCQMAFVLTTKMLSHTQRVVMTIVRFCVVTTSYFSRVNKAIVIAETSNGRAIMCATYLRAVLLEDTP